MSRKKFLCMDCKIDTGKIREHYMLIDSTWNQVHDSNKGMLCVGCCEHRLKRLLTPSDFNTSHVNRPQLHDMSLRLLSRIRGQ